MIELKVAQESRFVDSTRAELMAYAEQLGIENVPGNARSDVLRKLVLNALGLASEENNARPGGSARKAVKSAGGTDSIFPSYNLSVQGIWGGRRHRLSLPRPEGAKYAAAEGFAWNGKHTFYIPYDEVTDVPEPIYQILITNKRRRPVMHPLGNGEVTTKWEFDDAAINYRGVDPVTANRAGSLMEWYQSRGTKWFAEKTERQLQLIAARVEVSSVKNYGPGIPAKPLSEDELRARLLEFFFGYPDAEADPDERIEA